MNGLPLCAHECEDSHMFSDIIDRKLMSVFGRNQGATFYTCLKFKKSASTGFQVLFIRLGIFFLWKVVLISVRETGI